MPGWVVSLASTALISAVSACGFLLARCRGTGRPFGPTSKWWAVAVVVITGAAATGLGVAGAAAGHHVRAAYIGLVVPSALWLDKAAKQHSREGDRWLPEALVGWLAFFINRMNDRMGDDLQTWCDERLRRASANRRLLREATVYYHSHIVGRFQRDDRRRQVVDRAKESILQKIEVLKLINPDTTPQQLDVALRRHPSTRSWAGRYTHRDLASRLQDSAENDLRFMLADAYRWGCDKLPIYGLVASGSLRSGARGWTPGRRAGEGS
jgi:hypothetical protein